jgi:hypothetical protein
MSDKSVENFLRLLKRSPSGAVFNPWWQVDKQNDIGARAPRIRREQFRAYLRNRLETAQFAVIGEALGYRGGHFTGIPMTSERILLEGRAEIIAQRTSALRKFRFGFSEPTATIVWSTLLRLGMLPEEFVLWNAFPWHSFDRHRGMLSNRTPTKIERAAGLPVLKNFLDLFHCDGVVALGKVAAAQLEELNIRAHCIRHPASGGAKLFRQQIAEILSNWMLDVGRLPRRSATKAGWTLLRSTAWAARSS